MGDTNGGRVLLHVLAPIAGGTIDIELELVIIDFDLGCRFSLRHDLDPRERGVPRVVLIEGRDPDEPVDTVFGAQPAVGAVAADLKRGRLEAGLVALDDVDQIDVEARSLGPALVHPQQHLGPVLRVDAAGAGEDRDDRAAFVVGTGERELERVLFEFGGDLLGFEAQILGKRGAVLIVVSEFE